MPVRSGLPLAPAGIPDPDIKQRKQSISAQRLLNIALSSDDTKWAAWVRVVRSKKLNDDLGRTVYRFETITVHPDTPPNRSHYVMVRAQDPKYVGPISMAPGIIISCDCERWMYTYEFAMWYRGAAHLLYSNKEFPIVTNPGLRPGACKHCIHSLRRLISAKL